MRSGPQTVGNDFLLPIKAPPAAAAAPARVGTPAPIIAITPVTAPIETAARPAYNKPAGSGSRLNVEKLNLGLSRHSLGTYALAFLLLSVAVMPLAKEYFSSSIKFDNATAVKSVTPSNGLNTRISSSQLSSWLQTVTGQPASIDYGTTSESISPSLIKSWLTITPSKDGAEDYIHVDGQLIASSLLAKANTHVSGAVNEVTITRTDGSTEVAYGGRNGSKLADPDSINSQALDISKNLFGGKGFQVSALLATVPFQNVTPAAFHKLLVADTASKKLYAYQDGQLINTFLSSDGKPSTPTPLGEFHIWAKFTSQTMTGPGYVQPNVPWVNYFDHSGDAVHGVYWRSASIFGYVNTSHGCVGIPVNGAEWVYNWAPIGTTVITTPN